MEICWPRDIVCIWKLTPIFICAGFHFDFPKLFSVLKMPPTQVMLSDYVSLVYRVTHWQRPSLHCVNDDCQDKQLNQDVKTLFGTWKHVEVSEMSTYKCRHIRKIVYTMYRNRIWDVTNMSIYPECRDTRCRDNECRRYLVHTLTSRF